MADPIGTTENSEVEEVSKSRKGSRHVKGK